MLGGCGCAIPVTHISDCASQAFWYTALELLRFSSTIVTLSNDSPPLPGGGDTPPETLAFIHRALVTPLSSGGL